MTKLYPFLSASAAWILMVFSQGFLSQLVTETIEGTALAPYQYRLLFAYLVYPLLEVVGPHIATWIFWFLTLSILAVLIDEIGKTTGRISDIRPIIMASFIVIPMMVHFRADGSFWNILEAIFIAAAYLLIVHGRYWPLYPLVILATLNRETAVFIPLMFLLIKTDWGRVKRLLGDEYIDVLELSNHLMGAIGLLSIWAVTYSAIRLIIGPVPLHVTLADILAINLGNGMSGFIFGLVLFSWLFWYTWKGWKVAPRPLRRAACVIPPYLLMIGVFGVWNEWRLLISMFPLMVPLAGLGLGKYSMASVIVPVWELEDE